MDIAKEGKNQIIQLLKSAKSIAIVPSKIAEIDTYSAAAGLYHILKATLEDTAHVSLIMTSPVPPICEGLVNKDELVTDTYHRELVVSVDYSGTAADKVHYDIEHDVLYLKISPVDRDFDYKRIKSSITGFDYDVIITVGMQSFDDINQMYQDVAEEFRHSKLLNFDNTSLNTRFGDANIIDVKVDTLSLLILQSMADLGFSINTKAAKALLAGIIHKESATLASQ